MRIFPVLSWMLIPGCWALTGPGTVRGPAGGSVAVRCSYDGGYESYSKYWYQESSGYIAQSNGTEAEVKRGRVSLQDNHRLRSFTVTVENLTPADAGTYLCGIEKVGFDPVHNVEVIVTPATAVPTPSAAGRSPTRTKQPASSSSPKSTSTWTTAQEGQSSSSAIQDATSSGNQDPNITLYILTPCVLLVLVLFVLAAVVLVRVAKRRKKALSGASVQRDKKINLSDLRVGNNAADVSLEYEVIDPAADTHQTGFYANAEILPSSVNPDTSYAEIQPHSQGAAGIEEVSYVTLTISTPDQQPIYANTEQRPKAVHPASPPEKALYSAVKKPKH